MVLGTCVACGGQVRIPINANPAAIVRCPRCGDDFDLGSVLEQAAPVLEIVEVPEPVLNSKRVVPIIDEGITQPEDRQKGDKFVVSPILQKGAKRKKRRRRRRSSESTTTNGASNGSRSVSPPSVSPKINKENIAPVASTSNSSIPSTVAPAVTTATVDVQNDMAMESESEGIREKIEESRLKARPKPETQKRRKRRSKPSASKQSDSGGMEWAKIIFGACLALPVAQLLIWHFAGTDPLNIGPAVSKVVPFVVPKEFQPEVQKELDKVYPEKSKRGSGLLPEPDINPSDIRIDELTD